MHAYIYSKEPGGKRIEIPPGFEAWFNPKTTAILSIDMHKGHLAPDATLPAGVKYPFPGNAIVEPMNLFFEEARKLNIPIFHVIMCLRHGPPYPSKDDALGWRSGAAWRHLNLLVFPERTERHAEHNIEGSQWLEPVTDTKPEDIFFYSKKRLSAFYPTELEFVLNNMKKEVVVITGINTDACDLSTAFDAANRDFKVVICRDLVRGFSPELEDAALKITSIYLGFVVNSDELVQGWKDRMPTARHPLDGYGPVNFPKSG